jgi:hypothetical protein
MVGIQSARGTESVAIKRQRQQDKVSAARLMVLMANGGASNMTARVASLTRRQRDRLRVVAAG